MGHRERTAVAFACGLVWPLAFAPFDAWPVALIALLGFMASLQGASLRTAAWRGFAFAAGAFGAGVWWVFVSMHTYGGLHVVLAALLTLIMILILSLYGALFGWAAARCLPATGAGRWLLGLPALWVAVEWLRGWFLSGFGWLSTGYAFIDAPLGAYAPVGGVLMVSGSAALTAGVFGYLLFQRPRWPGAVGALVLGTLVWSGAVLLERQAFHVPAGAPLRVALVQGNVTQDLKWDAAHLLPTIRRYDDLTADHWDADLIVWPEAALPALRSQLGDYLAVLSEIAQRRGTAVVMGTLVHDAETDAYYNAVTALGRGGGDYYKRHLVPFGEFFPVPALVRSWLRMMNLPYSDFTAGAPVQAPLAAAGQRIAASICFEAAYGASLARGMGDATLLVNVSNDAWFGDTTAPHQHLQIARMRAREVGRWMLRATNTGITATIDPDGRVHGRLAQFETGVLRARIEPRSGTTPYARHRDLPVLLWIALALGLALRIRYS